MRALRFAITGCVPALLRSGTMAIADFSRLKCHILSRLFESRACSNNILSGIEDDNGIIALNRHSLDQGCHVVHILWN
jgi:hypothetical protein